MSTGSSSFNAGSAQDAVVVEVRSRFVEFVRVVGKPFGIHLPVPLLPDNRTSLVSFLKEFCGTFLSDPKSHLWHRPTVDLSRHARMSIAMSLFLHRKVLPSDPTDLLTYAQKMAEESPIPDQDILSYVRKQTNRMFPLGWDLKKYVNSSLNATLPLSCCREARRKDGGCRMAGLNGGNESWNDRASFAEHVLTATGYRKLRPSKLISVETGGKHRTVSVPEIGMNDLRPLHSAMYNHISQFPWLLRGDAKPSKFSSFTRVPGEVFVSGDYESATDNLNRPVQQTILEQVLANSVQVPEFIKLRALNSLSMDLEVDGKLFQQGRGQLMGNLLSFPLLCVTNYLAFRRVVGHEAPVKVNGDDIVFRSTRDVADRWMTEVARAGLTLSRGKTSVDPTYFSLNSRLFLSGFSRVRQVPCLRSTSYFGMREGVDSLAGRAYSFCEGFSATRRSTMRPEWLRWNRKWIESSRRSITRGLGIGFSYGEIVSAGLWDREAWYLSLEKEKPLPLVRKTVDASFLPEGYGFVRVEKLTREIRREQRELGPLFVEGAWNRPRLIGACELSVQELIRQDCYDWYGWRNARSRDLKKRSSLLGLSPRNTVRFLRVPFTDDIRRRMGQYRLQRHTVVRRVEEPRHLATFEQDDVQSQLEELQVVGNVFVTREALLEPNRVRIRFPPPSAY